MRACLSGAPARGDKAGAFEACCLTNNSNLLRRRLECLVSGTSEVACVTFGC